MSLTELASRIAAGRLDAGVVCGAEALASLVAAQKEGGEPDWPDADPDRAGDEVLEGEAAGQSDAEAAVGANAPVAVYPLIENALRAAAGAGARRAPRAHRRAVVAVQRGGGREPLRVDPGGALGRLPRDPLDGEPPGLATPT